MRREALVSLMKRQEPPGVLKIFSKKSEFVFCLNSKLKKIKTFQKVRLNLEISFFTKNIKSLK